MQIITNYNNHTTQGCPMHKNHIFRNAIISEKVYRKFVLVGLNRTKLTFKQRVWINRHWHSLNSKVYLKTGKHVRLNPQGRQT